MTLWTLARRAVIATVFFYPGSSHALPGECSNDALRILSSAFARACDAAGALENEINGKQNLLASITNEYTSLNTQYENAKGTVSSLESTADSLTSKIQSFSSAIAQQRSQITSFTTWKGQWEQFKTRIFNDQIPIVKALSSYSDQISAIISNYTNQLKLTDSIADKLIPELNKLGTDTSVTLGTLKTPFSMTLNPVSGTLWVNATLPGGVQLSASDLQALASPYQAVPSFDPVTVALQELPLVKNISSDWTTWSSTMNTEALSNYYVCSRRFTDFFGPEQLGSDTISAIITGGSSAPGALARARSQLVLEWSDLLIWARAIGASQIERASGVFFENAIHGHDTFDPAFSGQISTVFYDYTVSFDVSHVVPLLQDWVKNGAEVPSAKLGSFHTPHLGFTVATNEGNAPTPAELAKRLFSQQDPTVDPIAEVNRAAGLGGLSAQELQGISSVVPTDIGRSTPSAAGPFDFFFPSYRGPGSRDIRPLSKGKTGRQLYC